MIPCTNVPLWLPGCDIYSKMKEKKTLFIRFLLCSHTTSLCFCAVCGVGGDHGWSEHGQCGSGASCQVARSVPRAGVSGVLGTAPGFHLLLQPAAAERDPREEEWQEKQLIYGSVSFFR